MRCQELIDEALDFLNDPSGSYHTPSAMLRSANRALRDVANRATTIREIQYTGVVEGQGAYGLTQDLLRVQRAAYFYRGDWDPLVKTSLDHSQWITHEVGYRADRPYYYDLWGRGRVERYSGGVANVGTLHFTLGDPYRGILVGDNVLNVNDGSEAVITRVELGGGSVTVSHDSFVGGTRDTLLGSGEDVDDAVIRIVSHNVFPHVLWVSPPPPHTSDPGEEPLWVYLIRTHYEVTQAQMDNGNDMLEIDLELESCLLYRLLYWRSLQENGPEDARTMGYQTDYETEYFKQQRYIRNRINEFESTWGKPGLRYSGRGNVTLSGVSSPLGHVFNRNNVL